MPIPLNSAWELSRVDEERQMPHFCILRTFLAELHRGEEASECMREPRGKLHALDPLQGLQEIATVGGEWRTLQRVLREKVELLQVADARIATWNQLGELHESIFDELNEAGGYQTARGWRGFPAALGDWCGSMNSGESTALEPAMD